MPRKQIILLSLCAIVALLVGMLAARLLLQRAVSESPLAAGTLLKPAREIADFELTDQTHTPFTRARLEHHWTLLFFGFTSCPDVCPTTLTFLAQLDKSLADLPANKRPQVVFVSVDSDRDTPEKVGPYVQFFDPTFTGTTGTKPAIDSMTKNLGIPYAISRDESGGYNVDHSAAVLLINPHAQLQAIFSPPHELQTMSSDLRRIVGGQD